MRENKAAGIEAEEARAPAPAPRPVWGGPGAVLGCLAGRWEIDREIEPGGSLEGLAVFEPERDGGLDYREQGELRLSSGFTAAAARRYLYRARPAGFSVLFAERPPRLFHEVVLAADRQGQLRGRARHLCGADLYLTSYLFLPDGRFVIRHRVRGPRKAYRMTTWYRRRP